MPSFSGFGNFFSLPAIDEATDQANELPVTRQDSQMEQFFLFLETAKPGDIGMMDISPWATNHEIMAKDFYYSATGKKCREIRLLHNIEGLQHEQHICVDGNNQWQAIRCISR